MNYIIESTPLNMEFDLDVIENIENKIKNNELVTKEELDMLLCYLCMQVRLKFTDDLENYGFEYKCDTAQAIIYYYLNDLGVIAHPCSTISSITTEIVGHSFITAKFNTTSGPTNVLIDPTYRQFLISDNCSENNYIEYNGRILKTPSPGYFIKDEDKNKLKEFLYKGYNELTIDFARIYGDSFFNTKPGYSKSFNSIPGQVYINSFLKGNERLSMSEDELNNMGFLINKANKKM